VGGCCGCLIIVVSRRRRKKEEGDGEEEDEEANIILIITASSLCLLRKRIVSARQKSHRSSCAHGKTNPLGAPAAAQTTKLGVIGTTGTLAPTAQMLGSDKTSYGDVESELE